MVSEIKQIKDPKYGTVEADPKTGRSMGNQSMQFDEEAEKGAAKIHVAGSSESLIEAFIQCQTQN